MTPRMNEKPRNSLKKDHKKTEKQSQQHISTLEKEEHLEQEVRLASKGK